MLGAMPARVFREWLAYQAIEPWRLEDEPGRRYPLPSPEELDAKMSALGEVFRGIQHSQR